jgi:DNA replication protein DnaC
LNGFADGLEEQLTQPGTAALSFEERLSLLVDREASWRDHRRRTRLLKQARLKYPQAAIEDLDKRAGRDMDPRSPTSLALGDWVDSGYSLLISGPTGAGKSWLACAYTQYACRRGHSALYLRAPRLGEELRVLHGNVGFTKWLLQAARVEVLLLDDWGMAPLDAMVRNDLLEMIDDRSAGEATIVTSQLLIEHWHGWIGDETIADAMLDRLMQRHHRIKLTGESLRKPPPKPSGLEPELDQN